MSADSNKRGWAGIVLAALVVAAVGFVAGFEIGRPTGGAAPITATAIFPPPPLPPGSPGGGEDLPPGTSKIGDCIIPPGAEELRPAAAVARSQRVFDNGAVRLYIREDGSCVTLLKGEADAPDFAPDTIVSSVPTDELRSEEEGGEE